MLHTAAKDTHFGIIPSLSTSTSLDWPIIFTSVLLTDFAYYWIHRSLNHGKSKTAFFKWFQKKHVTHHSVDVLDFLRGNISSFFDTAVSGFQVPLGIISFILGMDL